MSQEAEIQRLKGIIDGLEAENKDIDDKLMTQVVENTQLRVDRDAALADADRLAAHLRECRDLLMEESPCAGEPGTNTYVSLVAATEVLNAHESQQGVEEKRRGKEG